MKQANSETNRNTKATAKRLELYRVYQTMLGLCDQPMRGSDRALIELRVGELEREVQALPVGRERMILVLHYFEGNSIERCAELMDVSRSTAFRIHRRALEMLNFNERLRAMHA